MQYNFILVAVEAGVMKITLNRPEVLNSFTLAMSHELRAALEAARGDKSVRSVLITGAGRGFCAGQDLTDVPAAVDEIDTGRPMLTYSLRMRPLWARRLEPLCQSSD